MSDYLELKKFKDINLNDEFFDSLKNDYAEFEEWFKRKSDKEAYILEQDGNIMGFLYLKVEDGPINDISPILDVSKALKMGTLKIDAHGTKLGERFIKKTLDHAIYENSEVCYVTVFDKHTALIDLLKRYGFVQYGIKRTANGEEQVLVKSLKNLQNDVLLDYPLIPINSIKKYLLAIYPEYHTKMFPDSILRNETYDILEDVSYTNSIHKIYVCAMPVYILNPGDVVVIYRTSDDQGPAEYRAVATSICVVEEVKCKNEFSNFQEFYKYANQYSIFDKGDLNYWFTRRNCYTIKMTYNAALKKRITRKILADEIGLNREERWGFIELTDGQLRLILEKGDANESIIID